MTLLSLWDQWTTLLGMTATVPPIVTKPHPAKFSKAILTKLGEVVDRDIERQGTPYQIIDPMAGTGRIHQLADASRGVFTYGVELEPEWAAHHPETIVGNCMNLLAIFRPENFNAVIVSPSYGNRMADHHNARDPSKRNTYRHKLERPLTIGSSSGMQWSEEYRLFHRAAWEVAVEALRPGGIFVLNCKDHIRGGEVQRVTDFHIVTLHKLGLKLTDMIPVELPGNRQGANGTVRVPYETISVLRKGA